LDHDSSSSFGPPVKGGEVPFYLGERIRVRGIMNERFCRKRKRAGPKCPANGGTFGQIGAYRWKGGNVMVRYIPPPLFPFRRRMTQRIYATHRLRWVVAQDPLTRSEFPLKRLLQVVLLLSSVCCLIIGCASMQSAYRTALSEDTIEQYEKFLSKYPESPYKSEVKDLLTLKKAFRDKVLFTISEVNFPLGSGSLFQDIVPEQDATVSFTRTNAPISPDLDAILQTSTSPTGVLELIDRSREPAFYCYRRLVLMQIDLSADSGIAVLRIPRHVNQTSKSLPIGWESTSGYTTGLLPEIAGGIRYAHGAKWAKCDSEHLPRFLGEEPNRSGVFCWDIYDWDMHQIGTIIEEQKRSVSGYLRALWTSKGVRKPLMASDPEGKEDARLISFRIELMYRASGGTVNTVISNEIELQTR
jgi:hypothetical protein